MSLIRDIMTDDVTCVATDHTAADVARLMAAHGVGALPICGPDRRIKGVITDRDLVTKVVGPGRDAGAFPAGDLNQQEVITAGADDEAEDLLTIMTGYRVRRLPVIDEGKLVGVVTMSDIARALPHPETGRLVEALSFE